MTDSSASSTSSAASAFSVGERPIPEPDDASRPFFDATLRGELLLQHCGACGRWMWPAKVRCIECLADGLEWKPASGRATLYSFTLVHQLVHPGFKGEMPYNLALVDLEEGVRTHSSIVGVAADELRVGMPLSVVFVPASEHIAIPMFQPAV